MLFRTPIVRNEPERIDRKGGDYGAGAIYGVKIAMLGEAKGHGVFLDETTLDQIVEQGKASETGKKSRFTHPNACADGMGSALGKFKNFRREGNADFADLHFFQSAHKSPKGDLAGYVMDLAKESPEDFGSSISFEWEGEPKKGDVVRIKSLRAVDIVDSPAATDGLFSSETLSAEDPAPFATALLDTLFDESKPQELRSRVSSFLDRYLSNKGHVMPPATPPAQTPPTNPTPPANPTEGAPAALTAEDVRKQVGETLTAERDRCARIRALCDQAKRSNLAGKFIEAGTEVAEVQATLFKAICEDNVPVGDTGAGDQFDEKKDPDAQFKKEFADNRKLYQQMGFDEAGYIQSRRIDEGLDDIAVLTIKKDD